MRICHSAAALAVSLALAAPALAQDKMRELTPESLKGLLTEMGFKITQDKPSGTDYLIAVSATDGRMPINIYGTGCAPKNGSVACPGADFVTGFKVKDVASKQAAADKLNSLGVRGIASKGAADAVRMEVSIDLSAGLTRDELKTRIADYEKTADNAFNQLKAADLLAN